METEARILTTLDRFQRLWQRNLVAGANDDSAAIYQRLIEGYLEAHRRYHTLDHIEHCLGMFESCKSLVSHADALELAIWFHDVIMMPGRRDNEARSAALYLELSDGAQPQAFRELIKRLIMTTLHDGTGLDDADSLFVVSARLCKNEKDKCHQNRNRDGFKPGPEAFLKNPDGNLKSNKVKDQTAGNHCAPDKVAGYLIRLQPWE